MKDMGDADECSSIKMVNNSLDNDEVRSSTYSTITMALTDTTKSSSATSSSGVRKGIWSTSMAALARRAEDFWDISNPYVEVDGDKEEQHSILHNLMCVLRGLLLELRYYLRALWSRPLILLAVLVTFTSLCTSGLLILEYLCKSNKEKLMHAASLEALETGNFFKELFHKVLMPLYSIQQAVIHSPHFKNLPHEIGTYGVFGSAPVTHNPFDGETLNYRNVSGICDRQTLQEEFRRIVESTNKHSDMEGIIVNYRLAPNCVFCLSEPVVNFEDFEEGSFDTTLHIGKDTLHTPGTFWHNTLLNTFQSPDDIDVFGPINVTQNGINIMPELYCAHLAVDLPGYNLTIDGKTHHSWGFVMSYIHWSRLKERSGIYKRFEDRGLQFHLTRTDLVNDPETGESYEKLITIAKSAEADLLNDSNSMTVNVTTANGVWTNRVGDPAGYMFPGHALIKAFIILTSFAIATMLAMILIERIQHKNLLYKIMPQSAIQKLQRGQTVVEHYKIVTIFFSDIVSFTSMAGDMSPLQVMNMLNDLYIAFDKLVDQHNVYKVETIGDAYMVVGGAPHECPAPEAAERVASFALDALECVKNFKAPNGDRINIRAGMASGPVVAGVVGKSMPRYCFFGDTVNFASRMESSSKTMKIQCSDFTYRLLNDAPNYEFSLEERQQDGETGVNVKGKGHRHTWWILDKSEVDRKTGDTDGSNLQCKNASDILELGSCPSWFLDQDETDIVEAPVQFAALSDQDWSRIGQKDNDLVAATANHRVMINRCAAILEVRLENVLKSRDPRSSLSPEAKKELRAYVAHIESIYNQVEYHAFEHACHVMTSTNKLLHSLSEAKETEKGPLGRKLTNPLTYFSVVFAALIHDVGHTGQSNQILLNQKHSITNCYSESYAERLSLDLSLQILFREEFSNFRSALIPDISSKISFGKILFCAVLITDIARTENVQMGTKRSKLINELIEKYGHENLKADSEVKYDPLMCPLMHVLKDVYTLLDLSEGEIEENKSEFVITKAGLEMCVICEHIMQVCDVAHLMQSWENFLKWNFRLYKELMVCHDKDLMPDPSGNWNGGQIVFLDKYVLPLAERTESNLGTFLNLKALAEANKSRWRREGERLTRFFVEGVKNKESEDSVLRKCFEGVEESND